MNVVRWTGREARALRMALRMSVREFAAHLGYNDAAVSNWERRGTHARLRTQTQRDLDAALRLADVAATERLAVLLEVESRDAAVDARAVPDGLGRRFRQGDPAAEAVLDSNFGPTAAALIACGPVMAADAPVDLSALARDVALAKRLYQACRYGALLDHLPRLLSALPAVAGDNALATSRGHALAAAAYQVACSAALKAGHVPMAMLAADRSRTHAQVSGDGVAIAASARAVTHALLDGGYAAQAAALATAAARDLADGGGPWTAARLSVHGSLLLRGALAAGHTYDAAGAEQLLAEAEISAERIGKDGNAYWTAFGPANVRLHRISVAVRLGNAGIALDHARLVDLRRIHLAERRASFFIDVAHAYSQWGKHDEAYRALRDADSVAGEEVRTRPAVRRLVADLHHRSSEPLRSRIRKFAATIGDLV